MYFRHSLEPQHRISTQAVPAHNMSSPIIFSGKSVRLGSGSRELAPMKSTKEKLRRCVKAVDMTTDIFRGCKSGTTMSTLLVTTES
jgi:hypothetical protein